MKIEQAECSETSAYKIQTPGNYPEESIQHTEHGKSVKSRTFNYLCHPLLIVQTDTHCFKPPLMNILILLTHIPAVLSKCVAMAALEGNVL
jgi:hypothetical protein